jgi:hypothetical protein
LPVGPLKHCAIFLSSWSLDTRSGLAPEILLEVADYRRTASGKVQKLVRQGLEKTLR